MFCTFEMIPGTTIFMGWVYGDDSALPMCVAIEPKGTVLTNLKMCPVSKYSNSIQYRTVFQSSDVNILICVRCFEDQSDYAGRIYIN